MHTIQTSTDPYVQWLDAASQMEGQLRPADRRLTGIAAAIGVALLLALVILL